jgi:hypothetical protein
MKILKDTRFYLVVVSLCCLTLIVKYTNQKDDLIRCQTDKGYISGGDIEKSEMSNLIDSLRDENFIKSTELGRYDLSLEYLKEVNPKAYKQFETYMYTQTE